MRRSGTKGVIELLQIFRFTFDQDLRGVVVKKYGVKQDDYKGHDKICKEKMGL